MPATVTVIGPGLLGGSILHALRERRPDCRLQVWARRPETLERLRELKLADLATSDPGQAVQDSDLVVLCTPIEQMGALVKQFKSHLKPGALVTDVGSVKGPVHRELSALLKDSCHWIGSHPMAGSEQSGLDAARGSLLQGATTIITPTGETAPEPLQRLTRFWESLGCKVIPLDPQTHDDHVAQISHLPHLVAALLVHCVTNESMRVAGPGFRDTSRIAAGPPDMWVEIFQANHEAVAAALRRFLAETEQALQAVETGECSRLLNLLTNACQKRRSLP